MKREQTNKKEKEKRNEKMKKEERFHSVKVITFASHAKGSEFDPQWNH